MTVALQLTSLLLVVLCRQLKKAFDPMPGRIYYTFMLSTALFMFLSPVLK
jgi:hypothetical protein